MTAFVHPSQAASGHATGHPTGHAAAAAAAQIGRKAALALNDELSLAPKPGLVSFVDPGSHEDMDAHTFMRSLRALRGYFADMAALGAHAAPFSRLEARGLQAEACMLAATGGINTHRGAIFLLGLLCAAAGTLRAAAQQPTPALLRATMLEHWGAALQARCARAPHLPGGIAARRFGLRSASQEAALGFPVLFETVVPAWQAARQRGLGGDRLRLQVFFSALAVLDDSNLAHRGGLEGLQFARTRAGEYLMGGGAARPDALSRAWALHQEFVARRLSPGGCADLLAAACWLHRLGALH